MRALGRLLGGLALLALGLAPAFGSDITTVVGGGPIIPVPATKTSFQNPVGTASDSAGNLFIADSRENLVFRVDVATNRLTIVAGNGASGFGGDNGPATAATLQSPFGIALDAQGNLFIADQLNNRIRRVDATTGVITTVAGNGTPGSSGDGGDPTLAELDGPAAVAVDGAGDLFIADTTNQVIRKVSGGVINTVAGGGGGVACSSTPAVPTSVSLNSPFGIAVDGLGNLYIADFGNGCVEIVNGLGIAAFAKFVTASPQLLVNPFGVAVDSTGRVYVSDFAKQVVGRVNPTTETVAILAGQYGSNGGTGDGGPATAALLSSPSGIALDGHANLYIADRANGRVRRVDNGTNVITTVAGDANMIGDGGPASTATLITPEGVAKDPQGNIFIADTVDERIRRVDAVTGFITTVAGNGSPGFTGDGGPALSAGLDHPTGVAVDSTGGIYIADSNNNVIRFVNPTTKNISTVVGNCVANGTPCPPGWNGDTHPPTMTQLFHPTSVALDPSGTLFIADSGNHLIRTLSSGTITTVAGVCSAAPCTGGFNGDGVATAVQLNSPFGVALDGSGGYFIADTQNQRIRQVDSGGNLLTVAGDGTAGYNGGGGGYVAASPTGSELNSPTGVFSDGSGGFYIGDTQNQRVHHVNTVPALTTVAGDGTSGFSGDGGDAVAASLANPMGLALDTFGNLLIADTQNNRIRSVVLTPTTLSIDDVQVKRGTAGVTAIFHVTMSQALSTTTTVNYSTTDGTAEGKVDYTPESGQLTFAPGVKTATIQVPVLGTTSVEPSLTFLVNLYGFEPGLIAKSQGTGQIITDLTGGVMFFPTSAYSVLETAGSVTITVTRTGTGILGGGVTVDYATTPGTAQPNINYTPKSGTLTFGLGVASQTFTVAVFHDTDATGPLTVGLQLSNPQGAGASLGLSSATLTINDADKAGSMQFSAASYMFNEPSSGTTNGTITITRTGGLANNVTVNCSFGGGTAQENVDYGPPTGCGPLTFAFGEIVKTVTIPIKADPTPEFSKTIDFALTSPGGGGQLGAVPSAVVTIGENDPFIQFGLPTFVALETQGVAFITVTRTGGLTSAVSIDYATLDGTAKAGTNYKAVAGTLHFPVGSLRAIFSIPLLHDTAVTGPLTVLLALSNPQPSSTPIILGQTSAVLTITDADKGGTLQFSAANYVAKEPTTGTVNATIIVTRTGGLASNVTVPYSVLPGTAVLNVDYGPPSGTGTLVFNVGQVSQTFTVPILSEQGAPEIAKTVLLQLGTPTGGAVLGKVNTTSVLTITEDDPVFQFSAANYLVSEISHSATITVTRIGPATGTDTVQYQSTAGTAIVGKNYVADVNDTLTFTPGVLSKTFTIGLLHDPEHTGPVTIHLSLSNQSSNAALGTLSNSILTIADADLAGSLGFKASAYTVAETGGMVTVTVVRSGGSASNVSVDYAVTGGSAVLNTDYGPFSGGTLTFGTGVMALSFSIPVLDDSGSSGLPKTIVLGLSNPLPSPGATLGLQSSTVVTIGEPDPVLQFGAASYSVSELSPVAPISVTRTGPLTGTLTVQFQTQPLTAVPGVNYKDVPLKTLTFAPNIAAVTVFVPILHDTAVTGPTTVGLVLSNPQGSGALLGLSSAVLTISDVDKGGTVQFSSGGYLVREPATGTVNATIIVTRTGGAASNVTVPYSVMGGTAILNTDYGAPSGTGTLTFGTGATIQAFTVPILSERGAPESPRTVILQLGAPAGGGALGKVNTTVLTITEDDPTFQFSVANYVASELGHLATITVTRTALATGTDTVQYQTAAGTAVVGKNYVADVSNTLTFTPGILSRTFTVQLLHDTDHTGPVTVHLSLSNPSANAVLGGLSSSTLTITDVDVAGSLQFQVSNFAVQESVAPGVAVITVTRTGGTASNVTVNYATADGTGANGAVSGTDYVSASGTLVFPAGVTSQTFPVSILDDSGAPSGYRVFTVALSGPSLGATIGAQNSATVWIEDP